MGLKTSKQPSRPKEEEKKRALPRWLRSPLLLRLLVKLAILVYRVWQWIQEWNSS